MTRNLDLQIELAQEEVVGGDITDERHEHAAPSLFTGQREGGGSFLLPPQAAPEIELPRQLKSVRRRLTDRALVGLVAVRTLSDVVVGGAVDLWIEERLRDAGAGTRFLDSRDRRAQIEVVGDGILDQYLQGRIVEDLPPRHVRE